MAAEIADGWLPMFLSPKLDAHYRECLAEGFARPGARRSADEFEIPNMVQVVIDDDVEKAADLVRMSLGFYIGGMGAKEVNFHASLFGRMGYESEVAKIQDLFLAGRKDEAIASVPLALVEDVALVGPAAKIQEELDVWRKTVHDHAAGQRLARATSHHRRPRPRLRRRSGSVRVLRGHDKEARHA